MILKRSLLFGTAVILAAALSCTKEEPLPDWALRDDDEEEEDDSKQNDPTTDPGTSDNDITGDPSTYGWLELPAQSDTYDNTVTSAFLTIKGTRNYSYLYDKDTYTAIWVAYPLCDNDLGGSRYSGDWMMNPNLDASWQINIWSGSYNVDIDDIASPDGLTTDFYARGHQIPDADRRGDLEMQKQTYYATNSTPQMQYNFNGTVWMYLESAVRDMIPSGDTLYVVTGAAFNKVGESKTVTYIHPKWDSKSCPVPNYYYKVLLKVKRSGGKLTAASALGFWLDHKAGYGNYDYKYCNESVDTIESYLGIDFFANLPDDLETTAETNSSISTFKNFN